MLKKLLVVAVVVLGLGFVPAVNDLIRPSPAIGQGSEPPVAVATAVVAPKPAERVVDPTVVSVGGQPAQVPLGVGLAFAGGVLVFFAFLHTLGMAFGAAIEAATPRPKR